MLSANTRVSYVLAADLGHLKLMCGGGTSELLEQLLCRMLTEGSYEKHRKRIADRLLESGGRVAQWLERLGCVAPFSGGMFIWAQLPEGEDAEILARKGMVQGLLLAPGSLFSRHQRFARFMRFNVAYSDDPHVEQAFSALISNA